MLFEMMWAQPPAIPPEFLQLLLRHVGVSDHDLTVTLPAGGAVAMLLPVHDNAEVAVAGVERLRVSLPSFLDALRHEPPFRSGQQALLVGEFSDPPRQQDLQPLTLSQQDIQALGGCKPGNCSLKLSATMMERFRDQGQGSLPGLFQEAILQYLTQYRKQGNPAMIVYADKSTSVSSLDEFHTVLREYSWLSVEAPPLYACLDSFAGGACPEIESFYYWSSAKFGFKVVFSVTHVMIDRTMRAGRPWVFIAFKQIYADHYFNASLGVAVLAEQSSAPSNPELWVLYMNRSRTDALTGFLGPLKRSVTKSRSRAAMQNSLLQLKQRLENSSSRP